MLARTLKACVVLSRGSPSVPLTTPRMGSATAEMTSPQKPSRPTASSAGTRYLHASPDHAGHPTAAGMESSGLARMTLILISWIIARCDINIT